MANKQRPIVNQRLYFCRLHLDYLAAELDQQQTAQAIVEQALGESMVLHLMLTYRAYLQEIATAYTIPLVDFETAQQLIAALSRQHHQSAEARELIALEQDGWLHEIFSSYQQLGRSRSQSRPSAKSNAALGIVITQLESHESSGLESYRYYFQSLSELIENQRARLEEW